MLGHVQKALMPYAHGLFLCTTTAYGLSSSVSNAACMAAALGIFGPVTAGEAVPAGKAVSAAASSEVAGRRSRRASTIPRPPRVGVFWVLPVGR